MDNRQIPDDEIDILKLFQALWKKGLVIVFVSLLTALSTLGVSLAFISPRYEATASFYVNNSSYAFGTTRFSITSAELTASNSLVNTYIYILESRTVMENVIAQAGLSYDYEKLSKMITPEAVVDTAAFEVTVRSKSPQESELIANTIADILPERIAELVDGSSVRIVDYAIVPAHRAFPSDILLTAIGFFVGAFISCGVVAIQYLRNVQDDDMIHSAEELKKLYPRYRVLALIPDMSLSEKKGYYYSSYYNSKRKGEK